MAPPIQVQLADLDPDEALADFLVTLALVSGSTAPLAWEPGDLTYDLSDTVTTWFCNQWNKWIAPKIRSQYLSSASGDDLTYSAWTGYNRPREEATFAAGDVVVENRGVFVGTIQPGTLRTPPNAAGKTFTNTTSAFMPLWSGSGPYPTASFTFEADEQGAASNTLPNTIPTYPTPLSAAPSGSFYVQSNATLLGSDEEADPLVKRRCQLAAAEEGLTPLERLEAVARDPIGAMRRAKKPIPKTWPPTVNVTRVRIVEVGGGAFFVYLAGPAGAAAGTTSTPDTDVYVCNFAIQLLAVPVGGTCTVGPANEVPINYGTIGVKIRRESNVPKADAEATANAALVAFWRTLAIGGERLMANGQGYALIDHVRAEALAGDGAFEVAFSGVHVDTALQPNEVAVPTYTVVATLVTQGT